MGASFLAQVRPIHRISEFPQVLPSFYIAMVKLNTVPYLKPPAAAISDAKNE
jgi:hypothetical protein